MHSGDKWIDRIAKVLLKLDEDDIDNITRIIIDSKRGEDVRLKVYVTHSWGEKEVLDILPTAEGAYVISAGEEEDNCRCARCGQSLHHDHACPVISEIPHNA